jgi:hypothetical protein
MGVLEAMLAFVGLVAVARGLDRWRYQEEPESLPEEDLAAPYREGLYAAIRMQTVAQELEQQMYAEAIRRTDSQSGSGSDA